MDEHLQNIENDCSQSLTEKFISGFTNLGLASEEIADIIWLALETQKYEELYIEDAVHESEPSPIELSVPDSFTPSRRIRSNPFDVRVSVGQSKSQHSKDKNKAGPEEKRSIGAYPTGDHHDLVVKLPDSRSLREPLLLARALRSLLLQVPGTAMVLDEAATIDRIADEQLWMPVLKPELEPWLDLALVVDESKSMLLWKKTVREVQRLLKSYGIFRNVQTWRMVIETTETDTGQAQNRLRLRSGSGKGACHKSTHSPAELIAPNGRRLILIVTDCIAPYWHDGTVLPALKIWSKGGSTAILQMLPEWLWERTALALAAPVRFRALLPGVPNHNLKVKPLSAWDEIDFENGAQVPVVTLDPKIFTVWSQLVAGQGGLWAPGFVFEPEFFELDSDFEDDDFSEADLSANQRVRQFYNSASPTAWKLATLLAAAPTITMPIVRIIRAELLPESKQANVAEVFLGGLLNPLEALSTITPDVEPDTIQYEFFEGVRDLLLESSPVNVSENILSSVSAFINRRQWDSPDEFIAYLKDPKKTGNSDFHNPSFINMTAQILRKLGGQYAVYAQQFETTDAASLSTADTSMGTDDLGEAVSNISLASVENSSATSNRKKRDEHLFGAGPKRILSIDGGGIRSMFSLQILHKIEAIIRQRMGDDTACLADYFDLIGGTSTGSVIASGLALGWSVSKLDALYRDLGDVIFQNDLLRHGVVRAKFSAEPLRRVLAREFGDITLGDDAIRTGLAIMTKRSDTGSPWVLFNNPKALFFNEIPGSNTIPNRDYLLRQIIRASTAVPHFFEPERIAIADGIDGAFVDGGSSPHGNPSLQLLLLAILDGYNLRWPFGSDNLLMVSVGTGFKSLLTSTDKVMEMKSAELALQSLQSLMDDTSHLNELLLQMFSQSPTARVINHEVNKGTASGLVPWISYLRYDVALEKEWLEEKLGITAVQEQVQELLAMDNPDKLETFARLGKRAAERLVEADHFPSSFDIEPVTP